MKQFMLLMRGDDSKDVAPAAMQERMQGYMAWMQKMTQEGRMKAGQPLEPRGTHLRSKDAMITDGPFLEPKEIIGGYVILLAKDLDEATELARDCPLLAHCEIYVRPLLQIPGA